MLSGAAETVLLLLLLLDEGGRRGKERAASVRSNGGRGGRSGEGENGRDGEGARLATELVWAVLLRLLLPGGRRAGRDGRDRGLGAREGGREGGGEVGLGGAARDLEAGEAGQGSLSTSLRLLVLLNALELA